MCKADTLPGWLRRLATGQKPTPEETAKLNFPAVEEVSAPAWALPRRRFEETQSRVAAALRDGGSGADPMMYFLPHDCYHFGQVNYLRAMQGLPPIE